MLNVVDMHNSLLRHVRILHGVYVAERALRARTPLRIPTCLKKEQCMSCFENINIFITFHNCIILDHSNFIIFGHTTISTPPEGHATW